MHCKRPQEKRLIFSDHHMRHQATPDDAGPVQRHAREAEIKPRPIFPHTFGRFGEPPRPKGRGQQRRQRGQGLF
jgi:hypothetical protein